MKFFTDNFRLLLNFSLAAFTLGQPLLAAKSIGPPNHTPDEVYERLAGHFTNINVEAERTRYITSGLFLTGAALLSGALIAVDKLENEKLRETGVGVLGFSAGALALGGILNLLLKNDFELLPSRFLSVSNRSPKSYPKLNNIGETWLRRLSARSYRNRWFVGGAFLAIGATDLIWHLSLGGQTGTNFLVYKGTLFMGFGALFFLYYNSNADEEYQSFLKWKEGGPQSRVSFQWNVAPVFPGGAMAALKLSW